MHVNGFVAYFKGRLRECSSVSRVREMNVEDVWGVGEERQVKRESK